MPITETNIAKWELGPDKTIVTGKCGESSKRIAVEEGSATFADLLRAHRRSAALSQEKLAEDSGLSVKAIGALENGRRQAPYQATVVALGRALGLTETEQAAFSAAAARVRIPGGGSQRAAKTVGRGDNLPSPITSFVGRERELDDLSRLLKQHRLITVSGAGGLGKTRLALASAFENKGAYVDGVCFVELASVSDAASVHAKISSTLGLKPSDANPSAALAMHLGDQNRLLVLDNCEHLLAHVVETVTVILRKCPRIVVMTTSRERLGLYGEVVYRIPSLSVPPESDELTAFDARAHAAVQLFAERAVLTDSDFELSDGCAVAVADICRKLDGIALAIEIAAARLPQFGLAELRRKLDDRLNPLSNAMPDAPGRQRTLRTVVGWSYDLLNVSERALFRRLSVFPGGWTVDSAKACCAGPEDANSMQQLIVSLVDKSLLTVKEHEDDTRFQFLESTRDFAMEKLVESGEAAQIADRFVEWAAVFSDSMHHAVLRMSEHKWHAKAAVEFDNVYAALTFALQVQKHEQAARIFGRLRIYWLNFGRDEALRIASNLLEVLDRDRHSSVAAELLLGKANFLFGDERLDAVCTARDLLTSARDGFGLVHCYLHLAFAYVLAGKKTQASSALGHAWTFAAIANVMTTHVQAQILCFRGMISDGRVEADKARVIFRVGAGPAISPEHRIVEARTSAAYAETYFCSGDILRAFALYEDLIDDHSPHREMQRFVRLRVAACLIFLRDLDAAHDMVCSVLRSREEMTQQQIGDAVRRLAHIKVLRGQLVQATRIVGCIESLIAPEILRRDSFEHVCHEALLASLKAQLSDDERRDHQSYGEGMSLHEAYAEALS